MTLVDTNVLLDILTDDPRWALWSLSRIEAAGIRGPVAVNGVIYAELSAGAELIAEVDETLEDAGIILEEIPRAALFLAGKAFALYRSSGGQRTGVLPDFFIGAHATVIGATLLTRDTRRYRTYFPNLDLLTP